MSYHRRSYARQNSRHGAQRSRNPPKFAPRIPDHDSSSVSSSRPLPDWEKRFIVVVGAMSWERFLKAKKNIEGMDNKIYTWDDSAGKVAFEDAKQRFWAKYHGFPWNKSLPDADLYIYKNIDWDNDSQILSEISWPDEDKEAVVELDWFSIPLHEIKATGWDDCYTGPQFPKLVGY